MNNFMKSNSNYIDVSGHPLTLALQENWRRILNEFQNLAAPGLNTKVNNVMGNLVDQGPSNGKMLYTGKIVSIFTRLAPESCSPGEYKSAWGVTPEDKKRGDDRFLTRQKLTPTLEQILEPFHPGVGSVGFNLMSPGTSLSKHYGMVNKYIRFHLGLICDPGAVFLVNDCHPRPWIEGKVWAFDDGRAFHGTNHNGKIDRLILIVDLDASMVDPKNEEFF